MKMILGYIISGFGIISAVSHLDQDLSQYWDSVAFFMVVFGTLSVAVITLPSLGLKTIFRELLLSLESFTKRRRKTIFNALDVIEEKLPRNVSERLDYKIITDGIELIRLGIPADKIQSILSAKVVNYTDDCVGVANWLRSLSKYPPAFGLSGTIFGLTQIMRSLAGGADARETGLGMAIALVATLYGILLANLIISPLGERIKNNKEENEILCEIAIKSIIMQAEKTNKLIAKEEIGAYLISEHKKISPINNEIMAL
jgi:chemotaxis protein MotA